MCKVKLTHRELIDLLQDWDNKTYENIKDGDEVTEVDIKGYYIEITIGEEV